MLLQSNRTWARLVLRKIIVDCRQEKNNKNLHANLVNLQNTRITSIRRNVCKIFLSLSILFRSWKFFLLTFRVTKRSLIVQYLKFVIFIFIFTSMKTSSMNFYSKEPWMKLSICFLVPYQYIVWFLNFSSILDLDDNSCPINSYNQCDSNNNSTTVSSQKQKKFLQLLNNSNTTGNGNVFNVGSMRNSPYYNGSQTKSFSESGSSTSSLSDLDDITIVKEEPLSPHSSCPPSPNSNYNNPLPSISSINPDLMYDRKVRQSKVWHFWRFFQKHMFFFIYLNSHHHCWGISIYLPLKPPPHHESKRNLKFRVSSKTFFNQNHIW